MDLLFKDLCQTLPGAVFYFKKNNSFDYGCWVPSNLYTSPKIGSGYPSSSDNVALLSSLNFGISLGISQGITFKNRVVPDRMLVCLIV